MKIFINLAVFAILLAVAGVLYQKWGPNIARPVAAAVTSVPLNDPAETAQGAAGLVSTEPAAAAPEPQPSAAPQTAQPGQTAATEPALQAPPIVPDERMLLVAIEGRPSPDEAFQNIGTGFFAKLQGRTVLVTSGAALTGASEFRFILADGTPLPAGRFAARFDRDLIIMELGGRSMPHVVWPESVLPLARGTALEIRHLTFSGGTAQPGTSTCTILSQERGFYQVSATSAPPGSIVMTADHELVGVLSLDPRPASRIPDPLVQAKDDSKGPIQFQSVVTALATPRATVTDWNTKSLDSILGAVARLREIPTRTGFLEILVGSYPVLPTSGPILDQPEFFQLLREFNSRYRLAEADKRAMAEAQLDYGRQIDARLLSDVQALRNTGPIALHAWIAEEHARRRDMIRVTLTRSRRSLEISLPGIKR